MHTIEINIDRSIFENFMGLLEILPKDKLEVISNKEYPDILFKDSKGVAENTSPIERKINELLKEHNLLHFKLYKDPDRILYTHMSGTPTHVQDFHRLVGVLKENNIKFNDIGVDVIMIEED